MHPAHACLADGYVRGCNSQLPQRVGDHCEPCMRVFDNVAFFLSTRREWEVGDEGRVYVGGVLLRLAPQPIGEGGVVPSPRRPRFFAGTLTMWPGLAPLCRVWYVGLRWR